MKKMLTRIRAEAVMGMPAPRVEILDALRRIVENWDGAYPTEGTITHCGVEVSIAALAKVQAEGERLQMPEYKWKMVTQAVLCKFLDCENIFLWETRDLCDPASAISPRVFRRFTAAIVDFITSAKKDGAALYPDRALFYRCKSGGYYAFVD